MSNSQLVQHGSWPFLWIRIDWSMFKLALLKSWPQRASSRRSRWDPGFCLNNYDLRWFMYQCDTHRPMLHISVNLGDDQESKIDADSHSCRAGESTVLVQLVPSCALPMQSDAYPSASSLDPTVKACDWTHSLAKADLVPSSGQWRVSFWPWPHEFHSDLGARTVYQSGMPSLLAATQRPLLELVLLSLINF